MKLHLIFFFLISTFPVIGQGSTVNHEGEKPRLVVGIVVDQMNWNYLYRYQNRYSEDGFKRLLREGHSLENTFINHYPSYTAVGHATIYTGSVPSIHGITGNNWIIRKSGEKTYCTDDKSVETVGSKSDAGKMSPRNLLTTTITDELRISSNFRSKVVGISLKDRAAILPAGHSATAAYWFDDENGNFITSSYYMDQLPTWVSDFNEERKPELLVSEGWNTLYALNTYGQSSDDDADWEYIYENEDYPIFPHDIKKFYQKDKGVIRSTPFGNSLTLNFAIAAIDGYQLGADNNVTDFLTINFASTDYIGHKYGTNSVEIEDTYLRLDQNISDLLKYLDKKIGKNNYMIFLTADHGSARNVDYSNHKKIPAGYYKKGVIKKGLNAVLEDKFGVKDLVHSTVNNYVHFDQDKLSNLALGQVRIATTEYLEQQEGILYVIDIDNIGDSPIPKRIKTMVINGYNKKRTGSIVYISKPGWFPGPRKGTTHGNWNPYDTHIPLIFMGWRIKPGSSHKLHHMTDIAPTLSALLNIQRPNGCIGNVITEVFEDFNK